MNRKVFALLVLAGLAAAQPPPVAPGNAILDYTDQTTYHASDTCAMDKVVLYEVLSHFGSMQPAVCRPNAEGNNTAVFCVDAGTDYHFEEHFYSDANCSQPTGYSEVYDTCIKTPTGPYWESRDCFPALPEAPANLVKLTFYEQPDFCNGTERGWVGFAPNECYFITEEDGYERVIWTGTELVLQDNCNEGCSLCNYSVTAAPHTCLPEFPVYMIDYTPPGATSTGASSTSGGATTDDSTNFADVKNPYIWATTVLGVAFLVAVIGLFIYRRKVSQLGYNTMH